MNPKLDNTLPPEIVNFIARWGEVGRNWGLPRTAAQIHGLLLTAEAAMTADEIVAALGVARSNVSTSLRELRALGVVRAARGMGERKERFEALDDPWEAAANVAAARKAREFDPAAAALADTAPLLSGAAAKRVGAYAGFTDLAGQWAESVAASGRGPMKTLLKANLAFAAVKPGKGGKKKKKK